VSGVSGKGKPASTAVTSSLTLRAISSTTGILASSFILLHTTIRGKTLGQRRYPRNMHVFHGPNVLGENEEQNDTAVAPTPHSVVGTILVINNSTTVLPLSETLCTYDFPICAPTAPEKFSIVAR
jgi:hypothetical protein